MSWHGDLSDVPTESAARRHQLLEYAALATLSMLISDTLLSASRIHP